MLIAIRPGRTLRWAPHWGCADSSVVFDASSGDYWVLTPEGREVVQTLQNNGAIELDAVLRRLALFIADGSELVASLAHAGLLTGMFDGLAVSLPLVNADD